VILREKDLSDQARSELAARLRATLEPVGGVLIVAGRCGESVHLAAGEAFPQPRPRLVGRSCHSPEEVARAAAEGCDYVTVSPVFDTPSKPGYGPPLGVGGLAALARRRPSTYALGGVRPGDAAGCQAAGARGVAVMGSVMRDPRLVADYLSTLAPWDPEVPP
jgi:thiamine-phosphate pyrophosphorylase